MGIVSVIVQGIENTENAYIYYEQSKNEEKMEKYQAAIQQRNAQQMNLNAAAATQNAEVQAKAKEQQYNTAALQKRQQDEAALSQLKANTAISGVVATSGTPMSNIINQAENAELNYLNIRQQGANAASDIRYAGQLKSFGFEQEAKQYEWQSKIFMAEAKNTSKNRFLNSLFIMHGATNPGATANAITEAAMYRGSGQSSTDSSYGAGTTNASSFWGYGGGQAGGGSSSSFWGYGGGSGGASTTGSNWGYGGGSGSSSGVTGSNWGYGGSS